MQLINKKMKSTKRQLKKNERKRKGKAEAQRREDYARPTHVQRRSAKYDDKRERQEDRPSDGQEEKATRAAIGLAVAETAY